MALAVMKYIKTGRCFKMIQLCSLALAFIMATSPAIPVFSANTVVIEPTSITDMHHISTSQISLFSDKTYSENGQWDSAQFTATSGNGNYIYYWHQNDTSEPVKVYLYRTDSGKDVLVSSMDVTDQNSNVYFAQDAGSGTYKIVVEAYVSGGLISGSIAVWQYKTCS